MIKVTNIISSTKMKHIFVITLLILSTLVTRADRVVIPATRDVVTKTFGETKIELIRDGRNRLKPVIYEFLVYRGDEILSKLKNVYFEKVYASKDNRFFLGVSNYGLPGTAYVIFDADGNLIREVKHKHSAQQYTRKSVTIIREWYNEKKPEVVFDIRNTLDGVSIISSKGHRIHLLK
ncbi:hypothetical protein N9J83_09375 [Opitutales bacterium]|nr:hypothetical protein [Opitutales bacterium]